MWDIIKKDSYNLFINTNINLKLKVYKKDEYTELYIDYNGYNIIYLMVLWDFGVECHKENVPFLFCDNYSETYFIINNKDIDKFIDLIYFFIILNVGYIELEEKYKVNDNKISKILIRNKNIYKNWIITEKKDYKLFFNEEINLKLMVYEKDKYNEIYISYDGHNILFIMKVRGFRSYCKRYGINENMGGNPFKSQRNLYFIINKKDTSFFIYLIYKFINKINLNNIKTYENKFELY